MFNIYLRTSMILQLCKNKIVLSYYVVFRHFCFHQTGVSNWNLFGIKFPVKYTFVQYNWQAFLFIFLLFNLVDFFFKKKGKNLHTWWKSFWHYCRKSKVFHWKYRFTVELVSILTFPSLQYPSPGYKTKASDIWLNMPEACHCYLFISQIDY